nr:MAG: xanthine dehydrogenase family protein molybdopterin-binding subunit [Hyphomicrobiales bacterium]
MSDENRIIGRSVPRLEDEILLKGEGRFAADISFPNQLHMRVVRANCAHARIISIDTKVARALPGVVAVWTASDIQDIPPIDFRDPAAEALGPYRQPVLAKDIIRYVGEPLAAIFAEDPYLAEDAAETVEVELEELPPFLGVSDPPGEFAKGLTTEPLVLNSFYGDCAAAFASAHKVIALDLTIGRHSAVPLETRGALALYDPQKDLIALYGAAKVPHRNRDTLMRMLKREVHLHEGHVGGGFGVRGEIYPEVVLVCVAAERLGRPIKWIEDRYEHLMAANQSRGQRHLARVAVDAEGRVLALEDEFFHDQGGYVRTHGARVPELTMGMLPGPYRIPSFKAQAHFRLTNKTPCATYRAPGRFEGSFVRERLMDAAAEKLGIDRVELRRRNLIAKREMPFARPLSTLGTEVVLDSGDYALLLDKALARFGWAEAEAATRARRASGEYAGIGLGFFVEKTGLGPMDTAHVSIDSLGAVEVVTGGASVGQGFETVMAQICAEALGVDYANIRVVHGQTDRIANGIGAHASRATVMTGNAVYAATLNLRAKLLEAAAILMQTKATGLDIVDGQVISKGNAVGPSLSIGTAAGQKGLTATGAFHVDHMTYPYGVHMAQLRVDGGTGAVEIERYLVAYDVGRAVNPKLVEGQIVGGFAKGLGGTLFEEFLYDEQGQPLSVTFADYLIPTLSEVPEIDILVTEDAPSPLNPLGIKGAGEAGTNAVAAAIASAIDDAIAKPGAVTQIPITPQRLLALMQE